MNTKIARLPKIFLMVAVVVVMAFSAMGAVAFADEPTDRIDNFTVTVDVNDDASLNMTYHIDWTVLDEDKYGKLDWINLGVPNKYHDDIFALTDTIDHISDDGNTLAIYLDRAYGEGETVSVEFTMKQDHMYQIDKYSEGYTVYSFTPAWFDEMEIKNLTVRWKGDLAEQWQPSYDG